MEQEPLTSLPLAQIRLRLKQLQDQVARRSFELYGLEVQLRLYTQENLARSPRGWYRHLLDDESEALCEAIVIETRGLSLHIQYELPPITPGHVQPGSSDQPDTDHILTHPNKEDPYVRWLHTPEELARFSWTKELPSY